MVPSFAQRGGPGCCRGSCFVWERSVGCSGKDIGLWHTTGSAFLVTGDMLGEIFDVWMLRSISGDCGYSTSSWTDWPPLKASFPSEHLRGGQSTGLTTPGCPGWGKMKPPLSYLRGKSQMWCRNHILNSSAGRGRAALGLPWLPLPWGQMMLWCPSEMKATWKQGKVGLIFQ